MSNKPAVTLIAPVAPFRGGIAQHSTALADAFMREPDIHFQAYSFRRLYPTFLYPGETDRDPALAGKHAFPVRFTLDTLNPLTWRIPAQAGDLVVIPAWTFFVSPMFGAIARHLRRQGARVVVIAHNVTDHEGARWKAALSRWQLSAADGFIVHTADLARQLQNAGFTQPILVVPHPPYEDFPEPRGTLSREYALELLCFGLVRRYKGVDIALRALTASGLSDVRLTIAGEIWDAEEELRELAQCPALKGKVEFIDRYVSDSEAAELFARCDAVLAPYRAVTGSGVLALAQRYRRPVIASDLPSFHGLIEHGKTGLLFPSRDENALAAILRRDVTREAAEAMQKAIVRPAGDVWGEYARAILALVRQFPRIR
jgi:glycosyltransferase involved in cell wall biosynthesis